MTVTLAEVLAGVAREHHWRWWTHGDVRTYEVLHCHACDWTIRQKASMSDDDCYDAFADHLATEQSRAAAEWLRSDEVEVEMAKAILDAVAGLCGGEE
jgi:hypothetical protein